MASFLTRTLVLLVAGITLTAAPSFAQRNGRRNGGENGRRESVGRAQPRDGSGSRADSQRRAEPQTRVQTQEHVVQQQRVAQSRVEPRGHVERYGGFDNRAYGKHSGKHSYDSRYVVRSYSYRPYVRRPYVVPYGYRPYGYRPGWSLNLYFGRPYAAYGYPAYGYPSAGYGYYAIAPGRAYGAVRIADAPPNAQVFVDGYYAGVVDDYDGVFQHLNLEAGSHRIEIEVPGYPPMAVDVFVEPGRTITYHARIR
jgi:hypothetical protein